MLLWVLMHWQIALLSISSLSKLNLIQRIVLSGPRETIGEKVLYKCLSVYNAKWINLGQKFLWTSFNCKIFYVQYIWLLDKSGQLLSSYFTLRINLAMSLMHTIRSLNKLSIQPPNTRMDDIIWGWYNGNPLITEPLL